MIPALTWGHLRAIKRILVTEITVVRGGGTEEDPVHEVILYFGDDGKRIGHHCPIHRTCNDDYYGPYKP